MKPALAFALLAFSEPGSSFLQRALRIKAPTLRRSTCIQLQGVVDPWDVFKDNHVGVWRGIWETFDNIGDKIDTSEVVFDAALAADGESAVLSQTVTISSVDSDCERCFDSTEAKTLPLGTIGRGKLGRTTVVGPAIVTGPSVLRSGVMSTEVGLRFGDGRVLVTVQHAPAWVRDNPTPGQGPPDALDLLRVTVRREANRLAAPTAKAEAAAAEAAAASAATLAEANAADAAAGVRFWRGVPPFKWAQEDDGLVWQGHTHTWQPGSNVTPGGSVEAFTGGSVEAANGGGADVNPTRVLAFDKPTDVWHERFTGDDENTWHLRLPGGLLLQTPQRLFSAYSDDDPSSYEIRLAWLVEDTVLMRAVAEVSALEVVVDEASGAVRVSPPRLAKVTADRFTKASLE